MKLNMKDQGNIRKDIIAITKMIQMIMNKTQKIEFKWNVGSTEEWMKYQESQDLINGQRSLITIQKRINRIQKINN